MTRYRIVIVEERDYRDSGSLNKGYDAMPESRDRSRRIYAVLLDDPELDLDEQEVAFIALPGGLNPEYIDKKIETALRENFRHQGTYMVIDNKVKPRMVPDNNIGIFSELYPEIYEAIKNDIKDKPYIPTREEMIKIIRRRMMRQRELTWSHDLQRKEEERKRNQGIKKEPRIKREVKTVPMEAYVTNIEIGDIYGGNIKNIPSKFKTLIYAPSTRVTSEIRHTIKKKIEKLIDKHFGAEVKIINPDTLDISLVPYKK